MNIKKAEELSGVSRQNIRFYEREGLLCSNRNPENDYREYDDSHILTLKQIRAMRMVDMPLEQIRLVLAGKLSLAEASEAQQERLQDQQKQLDAAIAFCHELSSIQTLQAMNVDDILGRMERGENIKGLFQQWKEDYRKVVLNEREKVFTFIPDEAVTNPGEFTLALFSYANANGLDMVITKEGMYPEFTLNGIEYTAERFYNAVCGVPVATIRCSVKHPEDFEIDVPAKRKKIMKFLNASWLLVLFVLMNLHIFFSNDWLFTSWQGWVLLIGLGCLAFVSLYRMWLFHFNEKQ